jgi:soluble lytic murein transglycosylase-like protein
MILLLLILALGLWLWPVGLGLGLALPPPAPKPPPLGEAVRFPAYALPQEVFLCGERVPLDDPEVREDLDREFIITIWSRAQTTMWLKRAHRYFPDIERKLRGRHLPLDLKYVVLVESDLRPKARSPAGAAGPWQFIGPTAQRFQLKCNAAVDERLEMDAATDAALAYLQKLHQQFHNWPLALAAYNCGEGRVQKELAAQGLKDFYHLSLPEETERYVHRIIAAKIVLEDPAIYGYDLPAEQLYPPLAYDEVRLTLTQDAPVKRLADASGIPLKTFKRLNPWITAPALCPGSYRLKVPKGAGARFNEAQRQGPAK